MLFAKIRLTKEILRFLFETGSPGLLPKDLARKREYFKVTRHQVTRRIKRMNKQLEKEFGKRIAEQRGWHWALTRFASDTWNGNEKAG